MYLLAVLLMLNFSNVVTATDAPFTVSLRLLKPIIINEVRSLAFPDTTTGTSRNYVVSSTDDNSARFDLTGSSGANIVTTVIENSINLSDSDSTTPILVDNFTVQAPLALNINGKGSVGVGGTAHISSESQDGNYSGLATLRVTYQ